MDLKEFYDAREVPDKERVEFPKNVVLMVPAKDYDIKPALAALGLSRFEVNVLWPRGKGALDEEALFLHPRLVVQLGQQFSRRFHFVPDGSLPDESLKLRAQEATADKYIVLHHHDEFSLQDGLGTAIHLGDLLTEQRRSFMSVTNHGNIGGWIKQYNVCKSHKLKCIFGMEAYIGHYRGDDPEEKKKHRSAFHLVLLARTKEGFDNLIRIHNDAQLNGFYYSPRVNWEAIKKWGKGIIAMTACFTPGTMVETSFGFEAIESLSCGQARTHLGNSRQILAPTSRLYDGRMKEITCRGLAFPSVSTDEHEFFVVKKSKQEKAFSPVLETELRYGRVNKLIRASRRRTFDAEWSSDISKGDWLLYPADNTTESLAYIDCSQFNRGTRQDNMLSVSLQGRQLLRERRKAIGLKVGTIIHSGQMTKQSLYNMETGKRFTKKNNLLSYLARLGIDSTGFLGDHCKPVMSSDLNLISNDIPDKLPITRELMFLLGAYCAEGSGRSGSVCFSLNLDEKQFSSEIVAGLFSVFGQSSKEIEREFCHKREVMSYSLPLRLFFEYHCGRGAEQKRVPSFVTKLPFDMQVYFLRGVFLGDAHRKLASNRSRQRAVLGIISASLAMGVARILLRGHYYPTCSLKKPYVGKDGTSHKTSFHVSVSGKQAKRLNEFIWNGSASAALDASEFVRNNIPIVVNGREYYTSLVTGVKRREVENEPVHCLNVDEDHSFVVGFASVHNCAAGEVPRALMAGDEAKAEEAFKVYAESFDKVYIELQIIEMEEQREINRRLIQFAKKMGAETVISCDSHYLDSSHSETHSLLMYIRQKKTILEAREVDADVWDFDVSNLFYRTAAQMEEPFRNGFTTKDHVKRLPFLDDVFTEEVFWHSMTNTRQIALDIEEISLDSKVKLPKLYPDSKQILREKVNVGFRRLLLNRAPNSQEYKDRVFYEFDVINKLGWADYFLIMEKIITDAKAKYGDYVIGYGRGSAAGCVVSWCLGLTDVDPLKYGLLFERFLDESRSDPPDIDTDFDPRYRDKIKDYIIETFGVDNTCSIGTYGSYKTRAVILDIARALGLDVHEAMELTKSLELTVGVENEETGEDEESSIDKVDWDELIEQFADLRLYFEKHPEVLVHARVLRNQVKHVSTHAGGVIISDLNLKDRIPVFQDKNGKVVSCWNESGNSTELSSVGLVKFDILGLNNLSVVSDCIRLIEQTKGKKLERIDIPIDDKEAIKMGSKRDLVGIFQFENPSVQPVVDAVGMDCLEDVAAITSLIRPGPRDMGMDMEYARRKHGEPYDEVECLRTSLSQTYGVMTYQEQVMLIARELAGFTMAEANKLRKGMGKKKKEIIADLRSKFMKGAQKKIDEGSVTQDEVETVWLKISAFAKYGFNKSHAITYSALTCAELWLKYHFSVEYTTALINNTHLGKKKFGKELLPAYVNYARKRGFEVLGPDINRSQEQFTIEGESIRFSIGHIKNVANSSMAIIAGQPYKDIADFYERAAVETITAKGKATKKRINKKVAESLLFAGAFDCFGKREDVIRQYYECRKNKKDEVFQGTEKQWREHEEEMIGVCLSVKPLRWRYAELIKQNHWCAIGDIEGHGRTKVFGRIAHILSKTSHKGNQMYIVSLTDDLDSMKFFVFGGAMTKFTNDFKAGYVAAIPLKKFDDSETRFFDVDRDGEIVER